MFLFITVAALVFGSIKSETKVPTIELVNGEKVPVLGLGTFQMNDADIVTSIVGDAVDIGYRHIDTAYVYENEWAVGRALKQLFQSNKTKREDLFITTKVWGTYHKRSSVVKNMILSLGNLGLDYLDLALVHWPYAMKEGTGILRLIDKNNLTIGGDASIEETWKGMEDAYRLGLTKSIGVSNFNSEQLTRLLRSSAIKPAVNQIEVHPWLTQQKLAEFCKNNSIQVTAYCPIGRADKQILSEPVLVQIAANHKKTVPQVMLRWLIQRDIIAIPKTTKKERLNENINIFDFQLSDEEINQIFSLNKNKRFITHKESVNIPDYPFRIPY